MDSPSTGWSEGGLALLIVIRNSETGQPLSASFDPERKSGSGAQGDHASRSDPMARLNEPPFAEPLRKDGQRLGSGELGADAGARASAKGQILEPVPVRLAGEAIDVERVGLSPIFAMTVNHPGPDGHD